MRSWWIWPNIESLLSQFSIRSTAASSFDELPQDALLQALSCLHFHWRLSDRLHLAIPVLGLLVERWQEDLPPRTRSAHDKVKWQSNSCDCDSWASVHLDGFPVPANLLWARVAIPQNTSQDVSGHPKPSASLGPFRYYRQWQQATRVHHCQAAAQQLWAPHVHWCHQRQRNSQRPKSLSSVVQSLSAHETELPNCTVGYTHLTWKRLWWRTLPALREGC